MISIFISLYHKRKVGILFGNPYFVKLLYLLKGKFSRIRLMTVTAMTVRNQV
jgi:hypothetical protein